MLRDLQLEDIGPAAEMSFEFGERLNALTGDNGLGKSFVLDLVWWILTGTWAGRPAEPSGPAPTIRHATGSRRRSTAKFSFADQVWKFNSVAGRGPSRGPVVYLSVDRITVFDPHRNYFSPAFPSDSASAGPGPYPDAFRFGWSELWDGISYRDRFVCNGLIRDWVTWMRSRPSGLTRQPTDEPVPFELLEKVLEVLSPSDVEKLEAGAPRRMYGDSREIPTLKNPFGRDDTPVVLAAAGFRRALALAYLLVWTWVEHWQASRIKHLEPASQMVLLVDEVEMHLHPQWQRRILPALIEVVKQLDPAMKVQVFCTTHSPLVLASLETLVDESLDRLFNFDVRDGAVVVDELAWVKHGDASGWLASEVFQTPPYGSEPAQRAIRWAEDLMVGELDGIPEKFRTREALDVELRRVLAASDPFWVRWFPHEECNEEVAE